MTGRRLFRPDELPLGDASDAELASALGMARELEALTAASSVTPTDGFADRVMSAVAREPLPQPAAAGGHALRELRLGAFVASVADAWRVAFGGGRPLLVRTQAFALVLVTVVALGSLGGIATVGALGLLEQPGPPPSQPVSPPPSTAPSQQLAPSPSPSPSPEVSETPEPSESAEPSDDETASPDATEAPEDPTARPSETPEPGETQKAGDTEDPGHTEEPSGDHSGSSGGSDGG